MSRLYKSDTFGIKFVKIDEKERENINDIMAVSTILDITLSETDIGIQICSSISDIGIQVNLIPNTIICENEDSKLLIILDNPSQDGYFEVQKIYPDYRVIYIIQDWPSSEIELIQLFVEDQIRYILTVDNKDIVKQVVHFIEVFKKPRPTIKSLTRTTLKHPGNYKKTWSDILQSIHGVSCGTADNIVEKFATLQSLMDEYNRISPEHGKLLLKEITLQNGRKLGTVLSTKIYNVLFGTKPHTLVYKI